MCASPLPPETVVRMTADAEQLRADGQLSVGPCLEWLKRARSLALELASDEANRSGVGMNYDTSVEALGSELMAFAYYIVRPEDEVRRGERASAGLRIGM